MRRVVFLTVLVLGLIAAVAGAAWTTATQWLDAPLPLDGRVTLHVPPGAAFRDVALELKYIGAIRRPEMLTLYARYKGDAGRIKAGKFVLEQPLTPRSLLDILVNSAPRRDVRVTIPEGSNIWQVADAMHSSGICDRRAFLLFAGNAEGRLFPDTYYFNPGAAAPTVMKAMSERFDAVWAELRKAHPGPLPAGLNSRGVLTIASLVEEEAQVAEERPRIARVFYNRLAKRMRLETDPTCVYGESTYKEVPSPKRCKDPDNRWSTYMIPGLPPGPISSPGKASLEAALAPSERKGDDKVLFFVAKRDGTGAHHFSQTYAEHSRAVDRYLKRR